MNQAQARTVHIQKAMFSILAGLCLALAAASSLAAHDPDRSTYRAPRAAVAPLVDGVPDDAAWAQAPWRALDQQWLGPPVEAADFSGRYKITWTENRLYVLVEIVDDILIDRYRDPLVRYWDDDCLEIFLDEDFSGGEHQHNHNAFAYHFSLDNRAIDIGTDGKPRDYTHHVQSRWKQSGDKVYWEVGIQVYPDTYVDGGADNVPVTLEPGKVMGFLAAYCDNDGSEIRENFMGSEYAAGDHKDRAWIDAGLFGKLELVDSQR